MNSIKVEVEVEEECGLHEGLSYESYCFICLQPSSETNQEQLNSLTLFFSYLKISKVNVAVCEKCGEHLKRFGALCDYAALEKARLEMDYLLDFIQSTILKTNGCFQPEVASVRKSVLRGCKENIHSPRPAIILVRADHSKIIKKEDEFPELDSCDDWFPTCDDNSTSSGSDGGDSTPVVKEIIYPKTEVDFEDISNIPKPKKNNGRMRREAKCPKCSKILSDKKRLEIHMNTVHRGILPFKCAKCPKSFGLKKSLVRHINDVHLQLKPYKCDMCDKFFKTPRSLKRHKATPHKQKIKKEDSKTFPCDICEKVFDNLRSLQFHGRIHRETRFPCDICKKGFKTNYHLQRHVSTVHQKQKYYCKVSGCGKKYSQPSELALHIKLEHPVSTVHQKLNERVKSECNDVDDNYILS